MSEIDDFIAIIDGQMDKGVSRLKIFPSEEMKMGEVKENYHHGRCDVGSPWAKGTVKNFETIDCGGTFCE